MVIKLKNWIKVMKRWIPALVLIVFMATEIMVWMTIKPRLVEEVNNKDQYTKSYLFQEEFNKCVDKAVELSLNGRNTSKWNETLNSKINLIYYVFNEQTKEAYTNMNVYNTSASGIIQYDWSVRSKRYYTKEFFEASGYRVYYDEGVYYEEYESQDANLRGRVNDNGAVYIGIKQTLEPGDIFYANSRKFIADKERILFFIEVGVWSVFVLTGLLFIIFLYRQIGKKENNCRLESLPMDMIALLIGVGNIGILKLIRYKMISHVLGIILIGGMGLILIIVTIYQFKRKKLVESSVLHKQYYYWSQINRLPFGMLLGVGLYLIIEGLLIIGPFGIIGALGLTSKFEQAAAIVGLILWSIVGLTIVWRLAISLQETTKAATYISEGNIQYKLNVDKKGFIFKSLGNQLNLVGEGLQRAVNDAIKSESMKTQLITNVSHDLKTPLTSIINYIGLLKKQELPNEVARNYLEVLDEKSKRLKILIEDLVEISKATTGNIQVELEKLDLIQFMDQAIGEYKDKLNHIPIEVKFKYIEEPMWVIADGKHLWRIVENLFSNVVKYAMPRSRLYIDLEKENNTVSFTIKNMTKEAIEVLPEDLLQRFVRGEESRSTEGSGLGLAIAKGLAEAQGGKLSIQIDGDLFKVKVELLGVVKNEL